MPTLIGLKKRLLAFLQYGRYDHRNVFSKIFRERHWGDEESVSGIGSRMAQTEAVRRELPRIIRQYGVKRLFDAPCGDLNWMKPVLLDTGVDYAGGDIVPEVVELARQNSPDPKYDFRVFDITQDAFPKADLWVCRDVLFHLSYANIRKTFENFARSEIDMMLVTTHTANNIQNRDIWNGDFRLLDLFKAPFSLPTTIVIERFQDYAPPMPARDMVLLRRQDIGDYLTGKSKP